MFNPRWYKVLYDLWGNKTRTALIVLSITVGLFAVGMIVNARVTLLKGMEEGFDAINPSSGTIRTIEPFDEGFVASIRRMEGVREADARAHVGVRYQVRPDGAPEGAASTQDGLTRWRDIQLYAVPDYDDMRVNKIWPQRGAWPPAAGEVLIERAALDLMGAGVGDWVLIETADMGERELRIAGTVHDLAQMPAVFNNMPYGYISFDALEWLGEPRGLNELHIVAQNRDDRESVQRALNQVKDEVEGRGYTIPISFMAEPGSFPLDDVLQTVLMFLGVLGALALFLSASLIVNTTSALVTQQIRQIGILKAVGARAHQIVGMYLVMVLVYGLLALLLAVPLGVVGARALSGLMAGFFNFDVTGFRVASQAIVLQIAIGLLLPILAALYPISTVLRVTTAEAMSDFGMSKDQYGKGLLDRLLTSRLALARLAPLGVSRPLLLSLRNTFRRKGRLALTVLTLTLAGAMFTSIFSVGTSTARTLDDLSQIYQSDVWVNFAAPQPVDGVVAKAKEIPGVVDAEVWMRMPVRRVRDDGSQTDLLLLATMAESALLQPTVLQGRWLRADDQHALVISSGVLNQEPDLKVGDEITLKIRGRETTFRVVGVALGLGLASTVYASYDDIAQVTGQVGLADSLMVAIESPGASSEAQIAGALEDHFGQAGVQVNSVQLVSEESAGIEVGFNVVLILALVMAILLAVVGGLGLMGTLGINVLERTREIGVMRAIGAVDSSVAQVFVVEGIVVGVISWLFGTAIALPLSKVLSDTVGMSILKAPLSYVFSMNGALLWLVAGVILSALASFAPARSASRLTVREVLAYE